MKKNKKTILVTGGTGFIGSNICNLLVKKNFNVKIYDNNFRGSFNKIKTNVWQVALVYVDLATVAIINLLIVNL